MAITGRQCKSFAVRLSTAFYIAALVLLPKAAYIPLKTASDTAIHVLQGFLLFSLRPAPPT